MSEAKLIEEITAKFAGLMATAPARDIERNLRALVSGAAGRFDLVTREEFDIQRELLARARDRITALEQRIAELEARQGSKSA